MFTLELPSLTGLENFKYTLHYRNLATRKKYFPHKTCSNIFHSSCLAAVNFVAARSLPSAYHAETNRNEQLASLPHYHMTFIMNIKMVLVNPWITLSEELFSSLPKVRKVSVNWKTVMSRILWVCWFIHQCKLFIQVIWYFRLDSPGCKLSDQWHF